MYIFYKPDFAKKHVIFKDFCFDMVKIKYIFDVVCLQLNPI